MSTEPEKDLGLELQFLPDWAQENPQVNKYADYRGGGEDRSQRRGRREGGRDDRRGGPRDKRPPRRDGPPRGKRPPQDKKADRPKREQKPQTGRRPPRDRHEPRDDEPLPDLKVVIVPDEKGVESISREIKLTGKAYPIFQIAHLILERPERHVMEVGIQRGEGGKVLQPLYRCTIDGTMWLSEAEVARQAMGQHFNEFYEVKRTEIEGPKGSYHCVAQCGISGKLLGPPNYHGYQNNLARLHAERFSHMSFDEYKARVVTVHEEAAVEKWLEEAKWTTVFVTRKVEPPQVFASRDDARAHFRETHLAEACEAVNRCTITGTAARNLRSPQPLARILKWAWQQQRRFPLQIATHLSKQFSARGLQFFKRDKTVTHVTVARPKFLNLNRTAVSNSIRGIVEFIEATEKCTRRMILEALAPTPAAETVAPTPEPEGEATPTAAPPAERTPEQTQVVADLHWLIHQGHVIEFSNGIIETAKKPRPKSETKPKAEKPATPEKADEPTDPTATANVPTEEPEEAVAVEESVSTETEPPSDETAPPATA